MSNITDAIHTVQMWILDRPKEASVLRARILDDLKPLLREVRAEEEGGT